MSGSQRSHPAQDEAEQPALPETDAKTVWLRATAIVLATNLGILAWALLTDQRLSAIMLVYWLENVAVGVGVAVTILVGRISVGAKLIALILLAFVYGSFTAGHGAFILSVFRDPAGADLMARVSALGWLPVLLLLVYGLALPLIARFTAPPPAGELPPLGGVLQRMATLHAVLIFGAFGVVLIGATTATQALIVFMLTKLALELYVLRPRRRAVPATG